jgi:2,3-bisphosphoglycerate-dependent phosphoglycerate mutase
MGKLILLRHGESEWNTLGKWTGLTDVGLTEKGEEEARKAGETLKAIFLDKGFCSELKRAKDTLTIALDTAGKMSLPVEYDASLNERDYGIYTGKDKWKVKEEVGDEQFLAIRRGYETEIPEGENLKQVCERVHPYYESKILPLIESGKNVIVSAHGNSLRALIKYVEEVPDEKAHKIEMKTGEIIVYEIDKDGKMISKAVLNRNEDVGKQ